MKDRTSRVLAIIALVFMAIFIVSLIATLVDASIFGGGIGFIALGSGVLVFVIFITLKADGRGFSLSQMKMESEMKKIEQALEEQNKADAEASQAQSETPSAEDTEQNDTDE